MALTKTSATSESAGDSTPEDERALRSNYFTFRAQVDLLPPSTADVYARLNVAYHLIQLEPGEREGRTPVGLPGDSVESPAGFGEYLSMPEIGIQFAYDTRNSVGRTTRGWLIATDVAAMRAVNAGGYSSIRLLQSFTTFIEVLPRHRVLVLSAGFGGALPWQSSDVLPINGYVLLGRTRFLRGYSRNRFRDKLAWWSSAEYRYPVLNYEAKGLSVSAVGFFDLAQAGGKIDELFTRPPRWSAGFGFHVDTAALALFRLQLGFSPEGAEINLGLSGLL